MKLLNPEVFKEGFYISDFPYLKEETKEMVKNNDWKSLDKYISDLITPNGELFQFLRKFHEFESIEYIIALRDGSNPDEDDGIWHDDGSRVFAFSLSLTLDHLNIQGGKLGMRKKGQDHFIEITTQEFGKIILFLTGLYGYEHKIHKVEQGQRLVIAGWCS